MPEMLKFTLKGNRNYVQGTSLFNAFVETAKKHGFTDGKISVSFKHMIHNPLCALDVREPIASDSAVAYVSSHSGEKISFCINESKETEIAERQPFNEHEVCAGAIVSQNSIFQEKPCHKDRIELLVSLCKKMHQECIDSSKKWVFSRYDGEFPIPKPESVELKITKQVGKNLTRSDVLVNGQKIGDMYFS